MTSSRCYRNIRERWWPLLFCAIRHCKFTSPGFPVEWQIYNKVTTGWYRYLFIDRILCFPEFCFVLWKIALSWQRLKRGFIYHWYSLSKEYHPLLRSYDTLDAKIKQKNQSVMLGLFLLYLSELLKLLRVCRLSVSVYKTHKPRQITDPYWTDKL